MNEDTRNYEICCDFKVTKERKDVWNVELGLAEKVKEICEKYDIKYFIIWGSLLGAVRHKGFIPWDDDFDIGFLRKDFERFREVAKGEINAPFFFQDATTDTAYYFPYIRIRDSRTTGLIIGNTDRKYNNGIFIDLYPLDEIPDNKLLKKRLFYKRDYWYKKCLELASENPSSRYFKSVKKMNDVCSSGSKYKCTKIGLLYHKQLVNRYCFDKELVNQVCKIDFEKKVFSAPMEYTKVLSQVYGDYMKLPSKSKRGYWHDGQIIFNPYISYDEFLRNRGKYAPTKI